MAIVSLQINGRVGRLPRGGRSNVLNVNLKGTWMVAMEVSRYMVEHAIEGRVINISSSLGFRSQLKRVPYATSKTAVEHLTRNMAMELVQHKIRVNCLAARMGENRDGKEHLGWSRGWKMAQCNTNATRCGSYRIDRCATTTGI